MVRHIYPFSALFKPPPDQWGLRGDPSLWRAIVRVLSSSTFPRTEVQLIALIETTFERLTGSRLPDEQSISDDDSIYVKRYARGGMSTGHISLSFGAAQPCLSYGLGTLKFGSHCQSEPGNYLRQKSLNRVGDRV